MTTTELDLGKYKLGWSDEEDYVFKPKKGLNVDIVREMSAMKKEPQWMLDFRLRALQRFEKRPMAAWFAVNMPDLDFDDIYYYIKPTSEQVNEWSDLPDAIKDTSSPTRLADGIRTSSNTTSPVGLPRTPSLSSSLATFTPQSASTTKQLIPRRPASGSVTANTV